MTAEGWIQIAFDLSLLMALVFAVLAALVVPRRQHKNTQGEHLKTVGPWRGARSIHERILRQASRHPRAKFDGILMS